MPFERATAFIRERHVKKPIKTRHTHLNRTHTWTYSNEKGNHGDSKVLVIVLRPLISGLEQKRVLCRTLRAAVSVRRQRPGTPGPFRPQPSLQVSGGIGEVSEAGRKDSPLPQSLKQPQSSSSGGRRYGSSKPGRRRRRAGVPSGPPPPALQKLR